MKITDHIHALKIPFQITDPSGRSLPRFVYVYMIYGREITLIDSGVASSAGIIPEYLRNTGRNPEEISLMILTHGHPDHIGAAQAIKEISGCSVAAHGADRVWIENPDQQLKDRPVPGFYSLVKGSVRVDRILNEGDVLYLEPEMHLDVLHTPGHSPGSISLWMQEEGVLFSGDAITLAGEMPIYDDIKSSMASIQRLKAIEGINLLLSAWDEPRQGEDAYRIMDQGLDYLQRIHRSVIRAAERKGSDNQMEICSEAVRELGLPEMMANPLVCRSFLSSLTGEGKKLIGN
ncbi:MAG: MBL fold metallo-hydrolase [Methanothrix sp.]|mgnify:FL=1|jgi:glyoxylase-like metal-dependent hydrolase (beta-lactamase superfamily II)|nr:MBL fold metallo-hydrolase [Methanothrix sp.]HNQ54114.1 MBL fold metallo-hydrolase [Methanothrix sp.]